MKGRDINEIYLMQLNFSFRRVVVVATDVAGVAVTVVAVDDVVLVVVVAFTVTVVVFGLKLCNNHMYVKVEQNKSIVMPHKNSITFIIKKHQ